MSNALRALDPSDATLVSQACCGDEHAFAELYTRYSEYVAGVVCRILGRDDHEVDDIIQQAFFDASRNLGQLREPLGFRIWVARIAVRETSRRLTKRQKQRRLSRWLAPLLKTAGDPRDGAPALELYDALDRTSATERIPWLLHHVEGATLPEVAELCGISLSTVKRRITHCDNKLRRLLGE